jgi:hypothetical protein
MISSQKTYCPATASICEVFRETTAYIRVGKIQKNAIFALGATVPIGNNDTSQHSRGLLPARLVANTLNAHVPIIPHSLTILW